MRKKILAILSITLFMAMLIPTVAIASNEITFNALKLSGVKKYDMKLPTGGTIKTKAQIDTLLKKLPLKEPGKGTTRFICQLYFHRLVTAKPGKYESVSKDKYWMKIQKQYAPSRVEIINLNSSTDPVYCMLKNEDSKYIYEWYWNKGAKTGTSVKTPRTSQPSDEIIIYNIINYKVYKDEKILGDTCFVYSYSWNGTDWSDEDKGTQYFWISRKTGIQRKSTAVANGRMSTSIIFVQEKKNMAESWYKPPKNIKFSK